MQPNLTLLNSPTRKRDSLEKLDRLFPSSAQHASYSRPRISPRMARDFVNSVPNYLTCTSTLSLLLRRLYSKIESRADLALPSLPVCLDVITEPWELCSAHHAFCRKCCYASGRPHETCPLCRAKVSPLRVNSNVPVAWALGAEVDQAVFCT